MTPSRAQSPPDLAERLRQLSSPDLASRSSALYGLVAQFAQNPDDVHLAIPKLLAANPDFGESIRTSLIGALEREGDRIEELELKQEQLSDSLLEYHYTLSLAVGSLRDPRSIKGMLAAGGPGGVAWSLFDDLCPFAVDAIIERSRLPSRYWQGKLLHDYRNAAIAMLGRCLTRKEAMRLAPSAFEKAKRELLAGLGDADPEVRRVAAQSLYALREDAEVRRRLEEVAATDPYVGPAVGNASRFQVREAARYALGQTRGDWFTIVRDPASRACRLAPEAEGAGDFVYIGPIAGREDAEQELCLHLDVAAKDPSLCWSIAPENACRGVGGR